MLTEIKPSELSERLEFLTGPQPEYVENMSDYRFKRVASWIWTICGIHFHCTFELTGNPAQDRLLRREKELEFKALMKEKVRAIQFTEEAREGKVLDADGE